MDRIGPGAVLAARYRLVDRVQTDPVASLWRAEDLTLERDAAVRILAPSHGQVDATLDAARRSAVVDDARLQRVLGVGVEGGSGYVIMEWIDGPSAADLAGRVGEAEARRIVHETADSLATAWSRGLRHGRLTLGHVRRTTDGRVRVLGLAVDAALVGAPYAVGPDATDVTELVAILYALISGHHPLGFVEGLLGAPTIDGMPVPLRELRPETSVDVDELCVRTFAGAPPATPREVADALAAGPPVVEPTGVGEAAALPWSPGGRVDEAHPGAEPRPEDVQMDHRETARADADPFGGEPLPHAGGLPLTPPPDPREASPPPLATVDMRSAAGATAYDGTAVAPAAVPPAAVPPAGPEPTAAAATALPGRRSVISLRDAPGRPGPGSLWQRATAAAAAVTERATRRSGTPRPAQEAGEEEASDWSILPIAVDGPEDPLWHAQSRAGTWVGPDDGYAEPASSANGSRAGAPGGAGWGEAMTADDAHDRRRRLLTGAGAIVAVALVVGVGTTWAVTQVVGSGGDEAEVLADDPAPTEATEAVPEPSAGEDVPETTEAAPVPLQPGVQTLDPFSDDGLENDELVTQAIDGDPATAWRSSSYATTDFGGLKPGLGLVLTLGAPATTSGLTLTAPGEGGTFEVRTSAEPVFEPSEVIADGQTSSGGPVTVTWEPVDTAYVIVWFTSLPQNEGDWRAVVSEVQLT